MQAYGARRSMVFIVLCVPGFWCVLLPAWTPALFLKREEVHHRTHEIILKYEQRKHIFDFMG